MLQPVAQTLSVVSVGGCIIDAGERCLYEPTHVLITYYETESMPSYIGCGRENNDTLSTGSDHRAIW